MAKIKDTYDEKSIVVLQGLEPVRKKPGMYIGSSDHTGLWQILKEVISNALDEALAGHNKAIVISIDTKTNKFLVADAGRGIPVGIHETTKISTLTTILTVLHAGGKINADNKAYSKGSHGTFGVGVSVTNALSRHLRAFVYRDGQWYSQKFERGIATSKVKKISKSDVPSFPNFAGKGTIIEFEADTEIFGKTTFHPKEPLKWIDTISYFFPQVQWTLIVDGKKKEFQHKDGIAALVNHWLTDAKVEPYGKTFFFQSANVTCALQWTASDEEQLQSYVNALQVNVGTHTNALNKIITDGFAKYKTAKQVFKPEDLRVGLFGILNISLTSPAFGGQTKEKLISPEATALVKDALQKEFTTWLEKNKAFAKELISRAVDLRQAEAEFKINRQFASKLKTTVKGRTLLPASLRTSITTDPTKRELFLIEGRSADGTAKAARDAFYQEVLPLRGKILNVHKATDARIAKNKEVEEILQSIGFNPTLKDPYSKLRVKWVMLLSDADADGKHINLLISGFMYKALRVLIEQGRVFAVDLPLYTAPLKDKRVYADTLKELMPKLPKGYDMNKVTRMKGLGESLHPLTIVGNNTIKDARFSSIAVPNGETTDYTVEKKLKDRIGTVLTKAGFLMCHPLHPILIARNLKLEFVAADDLQQGDFMLCKFNSYICPTAVISNNEYTFYYEDLAKLQSLYQISKNQLSWASLSMDVCLRESDDTQPILAKFSAEKPLLSAMEVIRSALEAYESATLSDSEVLSSLDSLLSGENSEDLHANILTLFAAESILSLRWTPFIRSQFFETDEREQYDITITKNKFSVVAGITNDTYMANNFVVHNCTPEILTEIAFNKETRKLIKLQPVKGKSARRFLSTLEEDATFRRKILGIGNGKDKPI